MFKLTDYESLVSDAIKRNETIVLGCSCTVRYSGRAESYLDEGDRLVMVKSDGALIVHQPFGNAPINYMKPNTSHSVRLEGKKLILKGSNMAQKETMKIVIDKVHFFNSHKLEDARSIVVSGTEADMSDMIYENPEVIEPAFKTVSREEQTKYGFVDVLGVDKEGVLTVVECKRYRADLSAVQQLRRYVEKLMISKGITDVRGILAAPKITSNALKMLKDWGYDFVVVHPPKYFEEFDKKQSRLDGWG